MKILVTIDFSDITQQVIAQATQLANKTQATLVLLHVAEPHADFIAYDYDPVVPLVINPTEVRDQTAQRLHREHKDLQKMADSLREQDIQCKALMVQGDIVEMVLQQAKKLEVDMIIAGSHGKGLISQVLLGSSSEKLIRQSRIPILLVPANEN